MVAERSFSAELIAVGSELLLGEGVDTNSAEISGRLAEIGMDVYRHVTVGDNRARMEAVMREAVDRADAVIVTGGLGPTQDDVTREVVARVAGVDLRRRDDLVAHLREVFARMGREMPERNLSQADIPEGAEVLAPVGTAAGFALVVGRESGGEAVLYCLPGVPSEMRVMLDRDLIPDLTARGGLACTVSRTISTSGISESAVADVCGPLLDRLEEAGNPTIAFLASGGQTRVRVTGKAPTRGEAVALTSPVVEELAGLLGSAVAGVDGEGVEHAVARLLRVHTLTLAVAESITAGGIGARLVKVSGASDWFAGGLIVYATDAKERLAGVDPTLLASAGPVSEPVVAALAEGARERTGADVGLGIVGVAGPTEQNGQPVGTVCVAVALPAASTRTRTVRLPARSREEVQAFAATTALDYLRRRLAELGR